MAESQGSTFELMKDLAEMKADLRTLKEQFEQEMPAMREILEQELPAMRRAAETTNALLMRFLGELDDVKRQRKELDELKRRVDAIEQKHH